MSTFVHPSLRGNEMNATSIERRHSGGPPRDSRVDFARGAALLIIFSDHIPGNIVAGFTPQALGFSDMAEVFVFLSGYVCGMSYSRRLREQGFQSCQLRAFWRAAQLYVAKLVATVAVLSICVAADRWIGVSLFGDPWTIDDVKRAPLETFLRLALSRIEIHQFSILALYVLFLVTLPCFLLALRHWPLCAILASVLLYTVVQVFPHSFALPQPWGSAIWFNPLAWQSLFFSAAALGAVAPATRARLRPNWQAVVLAGAILELAFLARFVGPDQSAVWNEKLNLHWLRLLHFAAILVISWRIMPASSILAGSSLCHPLIVCGSRALTAYCVAGVLATLGALVFRLLGYGWNIQIAVNTAGWGACIATAMLSRAVAYRSKCTRAGLSCNG